MRAPIPVFLAPGDGRDTISGFDADDRLDLTIYGFTSIAEVISAYDPDSGVLWLDINSSVQIQDEELSPDRIIIGPPSFAGTPPAESTGGNEDCPVNLTFGQNPDLIIRGEIPIIVSGPKHV
ncbi:hypothetical protein AA309_22620 [Microvirga vignae]|uniref:Uncharacterized protein n=1 Tax=Microvirga vignae TaxID=1225564 RepID=A0A0H1R7F7_9HYPH|nr:hypothetical protein [Microvirga vignae]KLK90979.1 hypothetical protein AA309_22620 [Microvirga vignae]